MKLAFFYVLSPIILKIFNIQKFVINCYMKKFLSIVVIVLGIHSIYAQSIANFTSVEPLAQSDQFVLPHTHTFQKIIEVGDVLSEGGTFPTRPDFTGFVPIANSSISGYLSINSEAGPGGVTVLDINFNASSKLWETNTSQAIDFSSVAGTFANCSGTVTPWNTIISCEEYSIPVDTNTDGYYDTGWNVEINPATKAVIGKHWAMGNMAHENVTIHSNERTVYQGSDSNPGYLYKFVAATVQDLNEGLLYVYQGSKNGGGNWILIDNTTPEDRNNTLTLSANAGGTVFAGVEDVEIGPDGKVYFAVKSEDQVYRLQDSDPITGTTASMETFVGNMNYTIDFGSGNTSVPWSYGNDNLAFDGEGNLWVFQDGDLNNGDNNYIWLVKNGHTQANPKVEIFAITPKGSEPTGITFTPDYKYLFMSVQHPDSGNLANQVDASGSNISFSKETTLVIALKENLGTALLNSDIVNNSSLYKIFPNPIEKLKKVVIKGHSIEHIKLFTVTGKLLLDKTYAGNSNIELDLKNLKSGFYILNINDKIIKKLIIK